MSANIEDDKASPHALQVSPGGIYARRIWDWIE